MEGGRSQEGDTQMPNFWEILFEALCLSCHQLFLMFSNLSPHCSFPSQSISKSTTWTALSLHSDTRFGNSFPVFILFPQRQTKNSPTADSLSLLSHHWTTQPLDCVFQSPKYSSNSAHNHSAGGSSQPTHLKILPCRVWGHIHPTSLASKKPVPKAHVAGQFGAR